MDEYYEKSNISEISGNIKAIIYQNEENGYTVLRLDAGLEDTVTVVGCVPLSAPGEHLEITGSWEIHSTHGRQFHAQSVRRTLPTAPRQIYEYLASGAIKGIGAATATLIVDKFGAQSLEVIRTDPERLAQEVRGISLRRAREFSEMFRSQSCMMALLDFLSSYELKPEYAVRLYKVYGDKALERIEANPYLLATERIGGRFMEADSLALSMGFEGDSPERISAAIIYEMRWNLNNGHSFLPRAKLIAATSQLIGVEEEITAECMEMLLDAGEVVCETIANVEAVYLARLYEAETVVAEKLLDMAKSSNDGRRMNVAALCDSIQERLGITYAPLQRQALEYAAGNRVLALTGGPGTGKTTTIQGIIALFDAMQIDTVLCAPTGRAAKRMTELTGQEAYTVHRLLEAGMEQDGETVVFRRDEDDPLRCGAVILDECSMVDITLMAALLRALPRGCRLVLVGDADQLPSVGPGCVFLDILRSGAIATVQLNEVFRQTSESRIVMNAHRINKGDHPDLRENKGDFYFMQRTGGERIGETVVSLCKERLPKGMGFESESIQVLTPTRVRESGTYALNAALQSALNPPAEGKAERVFGEKIFREGDKVMQIRNNYDIVWRKGSGADAENGTGIFNGDVGRILSVDNENGLLWIDFDEKLTPYSVELLNELELAYAITVHKSQGSEYPAVVLVLGSTPERLLSRDLLYTAVTRARRLLVVVGDSGIFNTMVDNARKTRRYSGLRARLAEEI